jgi:hypothetical protein
MTPGKSCTMCRLTLSIHFFFFVLREECSGKCVLKIVRVNLLLSQYLLLE